MVEKSYLVDEFSRWLSPPNAAAADEFPSGIVSVIYTVSGGVVHPAGKYQK
jgi:hypothetical protein